MAEITAEDRARFPCHTDGAILGIKLIESLTSEVLHRVLGGGDALELLRYKVGPGTTPRWVLGQVASTLYDRDEIGARQLDWLTR